ncbi:homeobox protein Mohawk [Chrysoperla carnea]|uniref:homeobox protein Mohawk n=1 Tax=Chrysoperla carnea TaxID=189513 RepID=UPI001D06DFD6|nr:homeobox protein Mohawk [Chrysoperla carnea]
MEHGDLVRSSKGRSLRPIRNRRYNRRIFDDDRRPAKRLFTPEIKKYLKDWLIRRRENPYPSREEKKNLAIETGLTYIQVCNWFANWRRKLKNAGREPQRKTWSHLIKTYNSQAKGNVEHFSICSDDSIWEEFETETQSQENLTPTTLDHCYTAITQKMDAQQEEPVSFTSSNKYKSHIMEKYLRDIDKLSINDDTSKDKDDSPLLLTKWLESTANFQPCQKNYIDWCGNRNNNNNNNNTIRKKTNFLKNDINSIAGKHLREELDAAEALTCLANANIL